MKVNTLLTAFSFLFGLSFVSAQTIGTDGVRLLNVGAMNISGEVYILGDMQTDDPVGNPVDTIASVITLPDASATQEATISLTGNFIHNATGNAFNVKNYNWADRSFPRGINPFGTFVFVGDNPDNRRYITSTNPNFDRVLNYVAFPYDFRIDTNDTIFVSPVLGFDVGQINQDNSNTGVLYLQSDLVNRNGNEYIYTASLRVIGSGTWSGGENTVIVEQRVQEFREVTSGGAATSLFPFASPFVNMRAGVFAGNWVRRPLMDATANSFRFPYGNESNNGTVINSNQYVRGALDILNPTEAHLIRLQRTGFDYSDLDLAITAGDATDNLHDRPTFVFGDGVPLPSMDTGHSDGLLFTSQNLFDNVFRTIETFQTTPSNFTQNWVVGNSFTSGLNGQAIAEYLMNNGAGAFFIPSLFIFPHGATSYETYSIWDGSSVPQGISDIHAMGIFMIAAWSGDAQIAGFTPDIGSRFQVHTGGIPSQANVTNSLENNVNPRSARAQNSVLNFVLTPEDNPFVFSRTSIRLNENADLNSDSHNVHALRNASSQLFHLYGTNHSREMLQQNVLPYTAPLAMLSVIPAVENMAVVLRVEGAENFATDIVELYDRQTGQRQDLRVDNSYWFVMNPGDDADRFEIHFLPRVTTDLDNVLVDYWQAYSFGGELLINNLRSSYQGSQLRIHNASGMLHIQQPIANVPEERINISSLPAGVYLLSIEGRTVKFIK